MSEFVESDGKRKRKLLRIVNLRKWPKEDLFGLSRKAIDRWLVVNGIPMDSELAKLVETASGKLFFQNKSQEQISEDYSQVSNELLQSPSSSHRQSGPKFCVLSSTSAAKSLA